MNKPQEIQPRWLCIPTTPVTWMPLGVSPEDFDLILATIDMWKNKITATPVGRDSALCGDGLPQLDPTASSTEKGGAK